MAVGAGLAGVLKIGSNNVTQVRNIKAGTKIQLDSKAVMGDEWDSFLDGLKSGEGTAQCLFDPADATGQEAMTLGASVTMNVYPQGTAAGKKYLIVPAKVESVGLDIAHTGGPVTRDFGWRVNGAVTWGTAV